MEIAVQVSTRLELQELKMIFLLQFKHPLLLQELEVTLLTSTTSEVLKIELQSAVLSHQPLLSTSKLPEAPNLSALLLLVSLEELLPTGYVAR